MSGEAVAQGVCGVVTVLEACYFQAARHGMGDAAFVHGPVGQISLEEKFFSTVIAIVGTQVIENEPWKDGEAVFVPFALHNFYLHGLAVDAGYFEHAQFVEAQTGTIEQSDHAAMFDVGDGGQQVSGLILRKNSGKFVFLSGIELGGKHIRFAQYVLEEEAEALCGHAALVAAQVEGRLQVIDVENDLIAANGKRVEIVEVGEQKPDFRSVIANGSWRISPCGERSGQFEEQLLRLAIERAYL